VPDIPYPAQVFFIPALFSIAQLKNTLDIWRFNRIVGFI
jgi:hypothetical protein